MNPEKRKKLEESGWKVGSAADFLGLSDFDQKIIEFKLRMRKACREARHARSLTQAQAARLIGSSQSRIAKLEAGDPSVSVDLLLRAFFKYGGTLANLSDVFRDPVVSMPERVSELGPEEGREENSSKRGPVRLAPIRVGKRVKNGSPKLAARAGKT